MSLKISALFPNTPYNDNNIRWKIICDYKDNYFALYANEIDSLNSYRYKKTGINVADGKNILDAEFYGFHVFINRNDAESYLCLVGRTDSIKMVRVNSFLKKGTFCKLPCETWEQMEFLD